MIVADVVVGFVDTAAVPRAGVDGFLFIGSVAGGLVVFAEAGKEVGLSQGDVLGGDGVGFVDSRGGCFREDIFDVFADDVHGPVYVAFCDVHVIVDSDGAVDAISFCGTG